MKSYDEKSYICETCHNHLNKNGIPCQVACNHMASGPIPDKLKIKKRLNFFISKRIFKLTKVNFKGSIKMYETS